MAGNRIHATLIGPTAYWKQRAFLNAFKGNASPVKTDLDVVKKTLREQRSLSIRNLPHLLKKAKETFSTTDHIKTYWADDDTKAADIISSLAGHDRRLRTGNSSTVSEVRPELEKRGIELEDTYLVSNQDRSFIENQFGYFWQLPERKIDPAADWFGVQKRMRLGEPLNEDVYPVSLLGVNSVCADDGRLLFLQHTSNIEKLLRAERVIILAGLEKIVPSLKEATYQTQWAGNFGLESVLLDFDPGKKGRSSTNGDVGNLSHEPAEQQIHIIFLDNKRLGIRNSSFNDLLYCISCRACMKRCPNYRYFGKDKGTYPQQYLFQFLTGKISSNDLCVYCGNCHMDCPVGIDLPLLIAKAKSLGITRFHVRDRLLASPDLLARTSRAGGGLSNLAAGRKTAGRLAELTLGIHRDREISLPERKKTRLPSHRGKTGKRVLFYPGCYATHFSSGVAKAAVKLLKTAGYGTVIPFEGCCGMPSLAIGDTERAKSSAGKIIKSFSSYRNQGLDVITTCPSCSYALKHSIPALGIDGADDWMGRVRNLEEILIAELKHGKARFQKTELKVGYHLPCHLRSQGLDNMTRDFLNMIPGLSIIPLERGCCGLSGTFGQKKKYYDFSMETGKPLFEAIDEKELDLMCTECGPCKMQIEHGTGKKTVHPVELFADLMETPRK